MCSMCPKPSRGLRPLAGESSCTFIDWTEEETGWPTQSSCEPAGIIEERSIVRLGPSVYVKEMYSDDAASWPEPNDWAIDYEDELPKWLIELEGFSERPRPSYEELVDETDMLAPEEALAGAF